MRAGDDEVIAQLADLGREPGDVGGENFGGAPERMRRVRIPPRLGSKAFGLGSEA